MRRILAAVILAFACISCRTSGPQSNDPEPLSATVIFIDTKLGIVVINRGTLDCLRPETQFEIVRRTEMGVLRLGKARFEKFWAQGTMTTLVIEDGDIRKMRLEDRALYSPTD